MGRKEITSEELKTLEALKQLRESVAGDVQLTPEDLETVAGGVVATTEKVQTLGCCNGLTDNASTCFPCTSGSACA